MPTSRGRARHVAEHGVGDGGSARRLLERRGVEVGGAPEVVLAPHELGRCLGHRPAGAGVAASSSSAAYSVSVSAASTGTFRATSSDSSANQPTSLTTTGFPSESCRITLPDVSPIVGERRLTHTSQAAISDQSLSSSTYASRMMPSSDRPSRCETAVEVEAGRGRADEQEPSLRATAAQPRERLQQLRDALARVHVPERADQRAALRSRRERQAGCSRPGCGIRQTGPP